MSPVKEGGKGVRGRSETRSETEADDQSGGEDDRDPTPPPPPKEKKTKKRVAPKEEEESGDDSAPAPPPKKKKKAENKALKAVQASAGGNGTTQEGGAVSSFDNPPKAKPTVCVFPSSSSLSFSSEKVLTMDVGYERAGLNRTRSALFRPVSVWTKLRQKSRCVLIPALFLPSPTDLQLRFLPPSIHSLSSPSALRGPTSRKKQLISSSRAFRGRRSSCAVRPFSSSSSSLPIAEYHDGLQVSLMRRRSLRRAGWMLAWRRVASSVRPRLSLPLPLHIH
jgi:hypothetical protein